jgi:hypothetical protein
MVIVSFKHKLLGSKAADNHICLRERLGVYQSLAVRRIETNIKVKVLVLEIPSSTPRAVAVSNDE